MSQEFEYYRVHRANDNDVPLLDPDTGCPDYLFEKKAIDKPKPLKFKLGEPIPKKPRMADYHASPYSIISKKIYDVLAPLNIKGIQLLPAVIRVKNDKLVSDYWAIHIYNLIRCIDVKKSDCEIRSIRVANVKKIVLDKDILAKIALPQRLIFRLGEDISFELFHTSIVEAIMKVKPDGIKFTNIENWNAGSFFS